MGVNLFWDAEQEACSCWEPLLEPGSWVRWTQYGLHSRFLCFVSWLCQSLSNIVASLSQPPILRHGEKGGSQGFTTCPGGTQETRLETHWLRLVELNCCQQQRETCPKWSQVYRIPQGAIPFLLNVLKNRWIWHVYCLKLSCFISTSDLGAWQMCQTENKSSPTPSCMGFSISSSYIELVSLLSNLACV